MCFKTAMTDKVHQHDCSVLKVCVQSIKILEKQKIYIYICASQALFFLSFQGRSPLMAKGFKFCTGQNFFLALFSLLLINK